MPSAVAWRITTAGVLEDPVRVRVGRGSSYLRPSAVARPILHGRQPPRSCASTCGARWPILHARPHSSAAAHYLVQPPAYSSSPKFVESLWAPSLPRPGYPFFRQQIRARTNQFLSWSALRTISLHDHVMRSEARHPHQFFISKTVGNILSRPKGARTRVEFLYFSSCKW